MKRAGGALYRFRESEPGPDGCKQPRFPGPSEAQVLTSVMEALARHPKVAWRRRINSGFHMIDGERPFRSGFVGCSDIVGQLRRAWGGRFLAVECKSSTGTLTEAQEVFLEAVREAGGVAFVARSVDDVFREIPL